MPPKLTVTVTLGAEISDTMLLKFTKMHGLGNDFMVIDAVTQSVELTTSLIQKWGDRNFGVGFDQLLVVEPPSRPDVDFRYRIFNADGSEVEQCGNGARCFATFVYSKQLTRKRTIPVETAGGIIELNIDADGQVTVDMGAPNLKPDKIPFIAAQQQVVYRIDVGDGQTDFVDISAVSMGNPHGVVLVDNVETAPVELLGPLLECHDAFPQRANIGFMQVINRNHIKLRVFERGAGETLACGTGACAAVVAGHLRGLLDERVLVELPGGKLDISWNGTGAVFMTGPTKMVFEGQIMVGDDRV